MSPEKTQSILRSSNHFEKINRLKRLSKIAIIKQIEDLRWSQDDAIKAENHFTETLQPEKNSPVNKGYREIFGLRLYQACQNSITNIFPDWASLTLKSLKTLFDYIDECETNQKMKVSDTEYKFPYLEEIFKCGSLPFISFIWYYYQNHYLTHLQEIQSISDKIKEKYTLESISENDLPEQSNKKIELHVAETIEKLKNADDTIRFIIRNGANPLRNFLLEHQYHRVDRINVIQPAK